MQLWNIRTDMQKYVKLYIAIKCHFIQNSPLCTVFSQLYVVTRFSSPQQYPLSPRGPTDVTLTLYSVPRLRLVMVYEVVLEPDTERVV